MSRILTGDKLVASVRNRAMIPNDTSVYTDQDILDIANEEMDVQLLDKLLSLHEEHLTTHIDIPRNSSGKYEIPVRAIGNKLRDVALIRGSNDIYEMHQISIGARSDVSSNGSSSASDLFYIENNQVKLVNNETSYESIRMYFYLKPSVLTLTERAGVISNISEDTVGNTVTFTFPKMPKNFSITNANGVTNLFDIIKSNTPNKILSYDNEVLAISNSLKTITLNNSNGNIVVEDIKLGDYVALEEESPVPNIPTEMQPVLAQQAAVHILEAMGDTEGLANANRRLSKMETATMSLVDDRVELAPKKIKSRHGTINQGISSGRNNKNKRGY